MGAVALPDTHAAGKRPPGRIGWLLLSPMLAWLVVFVVAPTAILFVYAFCQRDELGFIVFDFTWENFARLGEPIWLRIFMRSLWYAGLTTVTCLVTPP